METRDEAPTHKLGLQSILDVREPVVQLGERVDALLVLPRNLDAVALVLW